MTLDMQAAAAIPAGAAELLSEDTIHEILARGLEGRLRGQRVLVLIPDHTRTAPLPLLFRLLAEVLHDARQITVMVALGTHLPLDDKRAEPAGRHHPGRARRALRGDPAGQSRLAESQGAGRAWHDHP